MKKRPYTVSPNTRPGRPPLPEEERLRVFLVYLHPATIKAIGRRIEGTSMNRSTYIRKIVEKEIASDVR